MSLSISELRSGPQIYHELLGKCHLLVIGKVNCTVLSTGWVFNLSTLLLHVFMFVKLEKGLHLFMWYLVLLNLISHNGGHQIPNLKLFKPRRFCKGYVNDYWV